MDSPSPGLWPQTEDVMAEALMAELRSATLPDGRVEGAVFDSLRKHRYFGLAVPRELSGTGADLSQCAAVQMRIAAINLGLAVGLNMHLFTVGLIREHLARKRDMSCLLLEAIATQNRIVASAFAEPGLGGSVLRSRCEARRVTGGYVVSGTKAPCSLALRSDLICLQFEVNDGGEEATVVALLPTKTAGVELRKTWNPAGMHASESDTIVLRECFVQDALIFHRSRLGEDDDDIFSAGLIWFSVVTTASYISGAKAALSAAARLLSASKVPPNDTPRAEVPALRSALGELCAPLFALEAACHGIASAHDRRMPVRQALPYAMALKHEAVETCLKTISGLMELCGGISYQADSFLARMNQDIQAIQFHPPVRFILRRALADQYLGSSIRYDLHQPA